MINLFEKLKQITRINEMPLPAFVRKQRSIYKLFPSFDDRVDAVGGAGGVHLYKESPALWHFKINSVSKPGHKYDAYVYMQNLPELIAKHGRNRANWKDDESGINIAKLARSMFDKIDFKIDHNCPADMYFGPKYQRTQRNSIYKEPEDRPPKVRNPKQYGMSCKHVQNLIEVLPFYASTLSGHIKRYFMDDVRTAEEASQKEMAGVRKGAEELARREAGRGKRTRGAPKEVSKPEEKPESEERPQEAPEEPTEEGGEEPNEESVVREGNLKDELQVALQKYKDKGLGFETELEKAAADIGVSFEDAKRIIGVRSGNLTWTHIVIEDEAGKQIDAMSIEDAEAKFGTDKVEMWMRPDIVLQKIKKVYPQAGGWRAPTDVRWESVNTDVSRLKANKLGSDLMALSDTGKDARRQGTLKRKYRKVTGGG